MKCISDSICCQSDKRLNGLFLQPLDSGLSGLFLALEQKGLLESTMVFVTGEFGRTPKINPPRRARPLSAGHVLLS